MCIRDRRSTNKKILSFTQPNIDITKVQSSVESAFDKFGYHGFLNIYGSEVMRDPYYGGLSLVYNPNYKYKDSIPEICHTLGYPRTNMHMGFILENIEVKLTVEVGSTELKIRDLLRLNEGSVVELERLAGDPLDILANGVKIAKGEVVMVGERFGIRFTEVTNPENRVQKL